MGDVPAVFDRSQGWAVWSDALRGRVGWAPLNRNGGGAETTHIHTDQKKKKKETVWLQHPGQHVIQTWFIFT